MDSVFYEHEQEDGISSKEAFRGLLPLLKPHRKRLLLNLALLILATVLSLAGPIIIQKSIDVAAAAGRQIAEASPAAAQTAVAAGAEVKSTIVRWSLLYISILLVFLVTSYAQRVHLEIIGQDIITGLKQRCFDHVLGLSVSYFDRNPVGRLLSRVESDGESLRQLFANIVVMLVGDILMISGTLAVMFYYNWKLTLLVVAMAPIVFALIWGYQRYTTPRFLDVRKRMADVTATMTEFLQGMNVVQVFNRQGWATDRMRTVNRRKFRVEAEAHIGNTAFGNALVFLEKVAIAGVTFFGALLVLNATGTADAAGAMSAGVIVAFILYIRRFFDPIHRSAEELHVIQRAIAGARRIFGLLNCEERIVQIPSPKSWLGFADVIRFENVGLSYTNDGKYAVRAIDFEIRKGEKVALVGVTGGGKSTIVNLLLRFYDPTEGRITVDGIDVRELTLADLRGKFGLVLQDIFLFPGNVRENITLGQGGVSEEALHAAAHLVSADRFVEHLPKGYDTPISDRGGNLSRGERQLLSFARAMVFNPQVLLLDEATSSVDPDTEKRIQVALKRLLTGRTSLIIAHRLSTILDADKILVIREGRIIERGTHRELLAQGGYYEKLFRLQFQEPEKLKVTNVEQV